MSKLRLDKGGAVREGEELDAQAMSAWLRNQGIDVIGKPTALKVYRSFLGQTRPDHDGPKVWLS